MRTPPPERRVLVVDDDANTTTILASVLRRMACTPEVARSPSEALEVFDRGAAEGAPFSVILLDLHLERRDDGLGVLQAVRRRAPGVEVLLCTGSPDVRPGDLRYRRMGARDVVKKPFRVAEIKAAIESTLAA